MPELMRVSPRPVPRRSIRGALRALRAYWRGPFSLKDPELAKLFGAGYESSSGVVVTEENAFTFSAVYDAVNQISADVAKQPLNLMKRLQGGGSEPYLDSKLHWLLKREPNPEMGSMEFRRTITAHALTCHGGFAEIERDKVGRPIALWLLTPDRVEPTREKIYDATNGTWRYGPLRYRIDNSSTLLSPRDIIHIHGLGYDGVNAYGMINLARQAIGVALAAEKFAGTVFKQGRFGGILSSDTDLDDDQQKEVRKNINSYKQGFEQFLVLFGQAWNYHKTGITPQEAGSDTLRDQQVQAVANFFNMPLHKLKVNRPGAVSYASVEAADLDYYKGCLLNWITLWEEELDRKLISPLEMRQQYVKHNANVFLRGDIKSRYDALGVALDKGVINADEWRDLEDMNPQPDGQGRIYLVQGAMVPKHLLEDATKAKIEKDKTPPPAPSAPVPGGDRTAEIAAAVERAARAEALAAETAQLLAESRSALAAAEASGAASVAELTDRRDEVRRLTSALEQHTVIAEYVRTKAADLEASHATVTAELREQTDARARAEAAAADAVSSADAAAADRDARIGEALAEVDRLREFEAKAVTLEKALRGVEATVATGDSERARLASERDQLTAELATTRAQVLATNAAAEDAQARAAEATAEADREQQRADAAVAALLTADQRLKLADDAIASERVAREAAEQTAAASRERVEAVEAERDAAQAALLSYRADVKAQQIAVLASHRGLIVDALGRMTRREGQQARSKQTTPEKLRRWFSTFPETHEAICLEALLPAIRVHLAWKGSTDDPVAVTSRLVQDHIERFREQITRALDANPEDFHATLDRILTRWETDRAGIVADAFLREAMTHVQHE